MLKDTRVDRSNLEWFSYSFRNSADVEYLPTNRIVFELKEGRALSEVRALAPQGMRFESAKYFRYIIAQSSNVDLLALANRIYESRLVKYAHPDFMVEKQRMADPLYDEQYYLNNTSGNLGTPDVDINAPEAWNITKGSSRIRVAVIDDGAEAHEDLEDTNGNSLVLNGYTPQTGGNGRPTFDQRTDEYGRTETAGHGMAVSGIIAATHNTKGVRGVAPNVMIVPVNIFNGGVGNRETPSEIADGLNWAWDEGNADVLSNSWGYPPSADFDVIGDAIQDARVQGRNGKGSIVVFSAGNHGSSEVGFPADVQGVLTVGAVDRDDNKWDYSPSAGSNIDVVAPSGDVNLQGDVRTIDRMGALGYERSSTDHYTPRFGGTSAAAPQASGVAALMLSGDPSLGEDEIRSKIKATADDYGSTNWDGSGRLDAFNALSVRVTVSGPNYLDEGEYGTWTALVSGGTGSYSYAWEVRQDPMDPWYNACAGSGGASCTWGIDLIDKSLNAAIRVTAYSDDQEQSATMRFIVNNNGGGGGGGGCNTPITNKICPPGSPIATNSALGGNLLSGKPVPTEFSLEKSYPNPVRSGTQAQIPFALPQAAKVTVVVYNVMGREVRRIGGRRFGPGRYRATVGTEGLASGMYLYRLSAGKTFTATGKLVVVQ